eukprot:UN19771
MEVATFKDLPKGWCLQFLAGFLHIGFYLFLKLAKNEGGAPLLVSGLGHLAALGVLFHFCARASTSSNYKRQNTTLQFAAGFTCMYSNVLFIFHGYSSYGYWGG